MDTNAHLERSQDKLEELKKLLLVQDRRYVVRTQKKVEALEKAIRESKIDEISVGNVLASAIAQQGEKDDRLKRAFQPLFESQAYDSCRVNTENMAEALFPVIGPATRKLLLNLFKPKQKGASYQIEQLFLIDNESGLPIAHVARHADASEDADLVSSMLSAIQSYVQEAFKTHSFEGLEQIQVGELTILLEWGPKATLATVINGVGPMSLLTRLQKAIEEIHHDFADYLHSYQGEDDHSAKLLEARLRKILWAQPSKLARAVRSYGKITLIWLILVSGLAYLVIDHMNGLKFQRLVDNIDQRPGYVIVESRRRFGPDLIRGLADPYAAPLESRIEGVALKGLDVHWSKALLLENEILLSRLQDAVPLEPDTSWSLESGTLVVTGDASLAWMQRLESLLPLLPGVQNVRYKTTASPQ